MSLTILDWIVIVGSIVITWTIGIYNRSSGTWQGLFLGNRNLRDASVGADNVGVNLAFTGIFLILSEQAYQRGLWVLAVPVFWAMGSIILYALYPRISQYTSAGKTLHQALGEAFDSADIRRIASLWTIAGFVGTVALEFYGGIRLLQWAGLPFLSALPLALLLAFVIGAFTASGGLRGVAYADIFLTSLSVISIGLLIWMASRVYSLNYVTELSPSAAPYPPLGDNVLFAIGMGVIFLPFQFCILDSWQRFAAWKGSTSSSKPLWVLWTGLILSILFCIPVFLGVLVRAVDLPVTPQGHPLLSLLTAVHLPTGVMGLLFAGMFAAMFSTADELLNCCSMSFLGDALQLHIDDKPAAAAADKLALSGQFYIGVFAVLSAALALFAVRFDRKISEMAVAVFSGQILFTVPILVALFRPAAAKAYGTAAKAALAIGFSSVLACVAISWLNDYRLLADSAPLLGLALSAISFAAIASLSKLRKAK